jgi:hypothetical protein
MRRKARQTLSILPLVLFVQPTVAQECEVVDEIPASFEGSAIRPGTYRLVMIATSGSRTGASTEGMLTLRPTSPTDSSPTTSREVRDSLGTETPLYGWTDLDFQSIGAPIGESSDPSPLSRDPTSPGVLVTIGRWDDRYPEDTPVLLVSTASNRRDGAIVLDGGGIGLSVRRLAPDGFSGEWYRWGIAISGSGHFCAWRVGE